MLILLHLNEIEFHGGLAPEDAYQHLDLALKASIYEVLACLRDQMHIVSFNLALATPPLGETDEDWTGFPVLVRIVDRGDLGSLASDVGAMELYASSVISSDPFEVARSLERCLAKEPT